MRNSVCHALGELAGNHVDPGDALGRANPGDKLLQSNLDSEIEVSLGLGRWGYVWSQCLLPLFRNIGNY